MDLGTGSAHLLDDDLLQPTDLPAGPLRLYEHGAHRRDDDAVGDAGLPGAGELHAEEAHLPAPGQQMRFDLALKHWESPSGWLRGPETPW